VNIRPLKPGDHVTATDIFYDSYNDLQKKRGLKGVDRAEGDSWLGEFLAHIASTDPGSALLAEADDGKPIGFSVAYRREAYWFLSFLFVIPDAQASGVGRALLEGVLPPKDERESLELATVIESIQPVSTALYSQYGITPRIPRYILKGVVPSKMPRLRKSLTPVPMTAAMIPAVSQIDSAMLGYTRPVDHEWWMSKYSGIAFAEDDGRVAGYAYLDAEGAGPAAATDESDFSGMVSHAFASQDDPPKLEIAVPVTSAKLFKDLLAAGGRMEEASYPFIYCSSEPGGLPPGYVGYSGYMP
jgi:GNAT superfamily N-acetyltransferase